jgi:hypothetical protein
MNLIELLIFTLLFILYTPNIVFRPFVKNKLYNLLLCSLFFGISIYLVNWFLFRNKFVEGLNQNLGASAECQRSTQYYKDILDNVKPPPPNILDLNTSLQFVNPINQSAQEINKQICQKNSKITLSPKNIPNPSLSSKDQSYVIDAKKDLDEKLKPIIAAKQANKSIEKTPTTKAPTTKAQTKK